MYTPYDPEKTYAGVRNVSANEYHSAHVQFLKPGNSVILLEKDIDKMIADNPGWFEKLDNAFVAEVLSTEQVIPGHVWADPHASDFVVLYEEQDVNEPDVQVELVVDTVPVENAETVLEPTEPVVNEVVPTIEPTVDDAPRKKGK